MIKYLKRWLTPTKIFEMPDTISFCETITAGPDTPWHIRRLSKKGPKYGGGADTKALCEREVSWDLRVPMTKFHLSNNTCRKCLKIYETL
jgi:hypothetical protein